MVGGLPTGQIRCEPTFSVIIGATAGWSFTEQHGQSQSVEDSLLLGDGRHFGRSSDRPGVVYSWLIQKEKKG